MLSEFQKRKMVEYGWPEEKIVVKGNSVGRVERVDCAEMGDWSRLEILEVYVDRDAEDAVVRNPVSE